MGEPTFPRELTLCINQIANDRAHKNTSNVGYRTAYRKEKAKVLEQVVVWLASGKTLEEVMVLLKSSERRGREKLIAVTKALMKTIWETP